MLRLLCRLLGHRPVPRAFSRDYALETCSRCHAILRVYPCDYQQAMELMRR
jgi:Prophage protein (DUF1660)